MSNFQVEQDSTFELVEYLNKLSLHPAIHGPNTPPLPDPQHRSTMMPLTLQPRGYRKLRDYHRVTLVSGAYKYFSKMTGVNEAAFRDLNVPLQQDRMSPSMFDLHPCIIDNSNDMLHTLYGFLFPSTEVILETLDVSHAEWSFKTVERPRTDEDGTQPLDPILFCHSTSLERPRSVKLVIIPIAPWEFGQKDFEDLGARSHFDDTIMTDSSDHEVTQWKNADRMRAYLYDLCLDLDCPFFAVTSYHQWSFGRFSPQYTSACFTLPLSYKNSRVSILGMLIYWIHSSFGKQRSFALPKLVAEEELAVDVLYKERLVHSKRFRDNVPGDVDTRGIQEARPLKRTRLNSILELTPDDSTVIATPDTTSPKVAVTEMPTVMITDPSGSTTAILDFGGRSGTVSTINRYRRNHPSLKEYLIQKRKAAKPKAKENILGRNHGTRSEMSFTAVSTSPSRAMSSADPLPEKLIPKKRNEFCEIWCRMIAVDEDASTTFQAPRKEVLLPVFNHFTGECTGDIISAAEDDCASSSSSLSACSLTPEELAEYAPKATDPDCSDVPVHQWRFDSPPPSLDSDEGTRDSEDGQSWTS